SLSRVGASGALRGSRSALTRRLQHPKTEKDSNLLKAHWSSGDHSAAHVFQHARQTPKEGWRGIIRCGGLLGVCNENCAVYGLTRGSASFVRY
ncbi:MAG: hypothetical protein ABF689_15815, partial [Gluconobacter cerinus]